VPLNTDAVLLLRQRQGTHPRYVFSYHGKRITQVSTKAWYAALEKAGIEDFRWHDLRHTWATMTLPCNSRRLENGCFNPLTADPNSPHDVESSASSYDWKIL
jgi:integrase